MKIFAILVTLILVGPFSSSAQGQQTSDTIIKFSRPLPRPSGMCLSTGPYLPVGEEASFLEKLPKEERKTGGWSDTYNISGKAGQEISWFGILRQIESDQAAKTRRLLVEMRYFDGLTDSHLQVISSFGTGDFIARVRGLTPPIKPLSLVRIYGTVIKETAGLPVVKTSYIRVWDWGLFTFMDYGKDAGNPKWKALRKTTGYSSRPNQKFYQDRLGKRD